MFLHFEQKSIYFIVFCLFHFFYAEKLEISLKEDSSATYCQRGYDWFCGFNYSPMLSKQEAHLKKVTSLKQRPMAKIFLNINLVIILVVTTIMYFFFSVPNTRVTSVIEQ